MSTLLLSALWRASIAGGIALLIVGALCLLLPRLPASWRCNLWRLAFLKALATLFVVGSVSVPILPHSTPSAPLRQKVAEGAASPKVPVPVTSSLPKALPVATKPAPIAVSERVAITNPLAAPISAAPPVWKPLIVALYLLGVFGGLARILWAGFTVRGLVRRAQVIEHPALAELSTRLKLHRTPRLARSTRGAQPDSGARNDSPAAGAGCLGPLTGGP
ncbi:MAG: hypothetical protein QM758_01345 [Armatimonas sp.]